MNDKLLYYYDILKMIFVILLIVALGLWCINSFFEYKYNISVLQNPCGVCAEVNKPQASCIQECFTFRVPAFSSKYNVSDYNFSFKIS